MEAEVRQINRVYTGTLAFQREGADYEWAEERLEMLDSFSTDLAK